MIQNKCKISVGSERWGIEFIERAFYGSKVSIKSLSVPYDNLSEVNSPYDCSSGSRKVELVLRVVPALNSENVPKDISLAIITTQSVSEAYGDYGEYIGTDSHGDCWIEADLALINELIEREQEYTKKMPNLSYEFGLMLDDVESKHSKHSDSCIESNIDKELPECVCSKED
jgi:hypothetical protein